MCAVYNVLYTSISFIRIKPTVFYSHFDKKILRVKVFFLQLRARTILATHIGIAILSINLFIKTTFKVFSVLFYIYSCIGRAGEWREELHPGGSRHVSPISPVSGEQGRLKTSLKGQ